MSNCKITYFQSNQNSFFRNFSLYEIDKKKISMNVCSIQCVKVLIVQFYDLKKMCDKAVEKDLKTLKFVPDGFKFQERCEKAVKKNCCSQ